MHNSPGRGPLPVVARVSIADFISRAMANIKHDCHRRSSHIHSPGLQLCCSPQVVLGKQLKFLVCIVETALRPDMDDFQMNGSGPSIRSWCSSAGGQAGRYTVNPSNLGHQMAVA
ncbi:hypothetical protein M9458_057422 [Cirrhinus mrigala]|uniref:Uncharacterized protein n=1 Tax=Cirrhinus mrigala TaxID=683832 RepID=A0ABD0MBC5_CIRMR